MSNKHNRAKEQDDIVPVSKGRREIAIIVAIAMLIVIIVTGGVMYWPQSPEEGEEIRNVEQEEQAIQQEEQAIQQEELSNEKLRDAERQKTQKEVNSAQQEIISKVDMPSAMKEEAARMIKAKAAPVRDAAQKARPLPLAVDMS